MNYRHSYHAGNFADVLKHVLLARLVTHALNKDTPFRYIDTHAGVGVYDLAGTEASRTGEWREGVGRLWNADLPAEVAEILAPWRKAVESLNPSGDLRLYPGSPEVVRALARPQDRLILCELHPEDARTLAKRYARDRRVNVIAIDGWTGLNAYVPPKERRGMVLIDPPFEQPGDLERMAAALKSAHAKWPTGTYALWYPIKDPLETDHFLRGLARSGIPSILAAELMIRRLNDPARLNGCGLAIVNPPWTLEQQLGLLMPALAEHLGQDSSARGRVVKVAAES